MGISSIKMQNFRNDHPIAKLRTYVIQAPPTSFSAHLEGFRIYWKAVPPTFGITIYRKETCRKVKTVDWKTILE